LRVVLGDQLSRGIAALEDVDPSRDVVLMMEVAAEATYVPHHPKKLVLFFSAMRHFARALADEGLSVDYVRLDDPENTGTLAGEVARALARHRPARVIATFPGEWRVAEDMGRWSAALGLPVEIREDGRFFATRGRFAAHARGRRQLRMEFFYREMRRETGLLMEDDEPAGGAWNFDAENRRRLPRDVVPPPAFHAPPDVVTEEVMALVRARFAHHFGDLDGFGFAVDAAGAERALAHFLEHGLPRFGDYQDAMKRGEPTLFHALVSPYLNLGLLDAREVCRRVEAEWRAGRAPLNAVEGFIRQILGWREYVRGLYWLRMPEYARTNALGATRPLPAFYWTGETDMACLAEVIGQTRRDAYAHHIQRLMVTGNFALLAGLAPEQVCEWYLAVYADALEWVELPNTHGMALFADGGVMGSKPYAASGKYIERMSDYCAGCRYDVRETLGDDACPFNALYWNFLIAHERRLRPNRRMSMIYASLDRMDAVKRAAIVARARQVLDALPPAYAPTV
jgi:deoxyribodipyrimidine photolyase-related protein